jgi:hypothetical protein
MVVFYEGILKDFDDSTFLLETPDMTVLINSGSAISIEVAKSAGPQNKGGHSRIHARGDRINTCKGKSIR